MAKNAQLIKVKILLIGLLIILFGCKTKSGLNEEIIVNAPLSLNDSLNNVLKEHLLNLNSGPCGSFNTSLEDWKKTLCWNRGILICMMKDTRVNVKQKQNVYRLSDEIPFEGIHYLCLFDALKIYCDRTTFPTSIELLRYEWEPSDPNASISYAPVNEYVHNFLITPHIKSIDGRSYQEYINEDAANRHFHVISTEEYYNQIKDLWESGRITLTSEE